MPAKVRQVRPEEMDTQVQTLDCQCWKYVSLQEPSFCSHLHVLTGHVKSHLLNNLSPLSQHRISTILIVDKLGKQTQKNCYETADRIPGTSNVVKDGTGDHTTSNQSTVRIPSLLPGSFECLTYDHCDVPNEYFFFENFRNPFASCQLIYCNFKSPCVYSYAAVSRVTLLSLTWCNYIKYHKNKTNHLANSVLS